MIRAGIVGVSGYSGGETLKLLLNHPQVRVTYVSANNTQGPVDTLWPSLKGRTNLICHTYDPAKAVDQCDLVFLAVPHTVAMRVAPDLLKNKKKVIDLSADYRLTSVDAYLNWYGQAHTDTEHLSTAVYGLCELFREKIRTAELIANPGCYPTGSLLGLLPLVSTDTENIESIIIDAKSGVSGAGKKLAEGLMFAQVNENFKAYKVLNHQHTPEIEQILSQVASRELSVSFVPHLLPVTRGILSTIYVRCVRTPKLDAMTDVYNKFYKTEPFVRVLPSGDQPELRTVNHTNYCDIALAVNEQQNLVVITTAIDNLMKGAAGQAVQNMNIMCRFPEKTGFQL